AGGPLEKRRGGRAPATVVRQKGWRPLIERGGARKMLVPLALCLGMAVVPVVALTHASPPPATPAASRPIRRVSAVADIALARHVADRLSPSDTSDTLPPTTTTTVPPRPVTSVRASYRPTLYRAAPQTTR